MPECAADQRPKIDLQLGAGSPNCFDPPRCGTLPILQFVNSYMSQGEQFA